MLVLLEMSGSSKSMVETVEGLKSVIQDYEMLYH